MPIDSFQERATICQDGTFLEVTPAGDATGFRLGLLSLYSSLGDVDDDILQNVPLRSRHDNAVNRHGKLYRLLLVSDKPDRDTGEYSESFETVKMMRIRARDSDFGKNRRFLVTYFSMGKRVPEKRMRMKRNGVEHEIMRIMDQGQNAFEIETETRVG
jgi:hypothetical protein